MKKRGQKFSSIKPSKVLTKELILFRIGFALLYLNKKIIFHNLVKFSQKRYNKINICKRKHENLLFEVFRLNQRQQSESEGEGDSFYKSSFTNSDRRFINYISTLINYDSTLTNLNSTLINKNNTFVIYNSGLTNKNSTLVNYNSAITNLNSAITNLNGTLTN